MKIFRGTSCMDFYHFLLNYHKYRCKYSENSLIITIFAVRFKCI